MDNIKNDFYYVQKIAKDLSFIVEHIKGITKDEFTKNEVLQDCMMFRLVQISENSERLTVAFKQRYSEVPWKEIKGMRNRLVHEYGNVDLQVVYDTVTVDVPKILELLGGLM